MTRAFNNKPQKKTAAAASLRRGLRSEDRSRSLRQTVTLSTGNGQRVSVSREELNRAIRRHPGLVQQALRVQTMGAPPPRRPTRENQTSVDAVIERLAIHGTDGATEMSRFDPRAPMPLIGGAAGGGRSTSQMTRFDPRTPMPWFGGGQSGHSGHSGGGTGGGGGGVGGGIPGSGRGGGSGGRGGRSGGGGGGGGLPPRRRNELWIENESSTHTAFVFVQTAAERRTMEKNMAASIAASTNGGELSLEELRKFAYIQSNDSFKIVKPLKKVKVFIPRAVQACVGCRAHITLLIEAAGQPPRTYYVADDAGAVNVRRYDYIIEADDFDINPNAAHKVRVSRKAHGTYEILPVP